MRNLMTELLAYLNQALAFERTLEIVTKGVQTQLRVYSSLKLVRIDDIGDVELCDEGFEVEIKATFDCGVLGQAYRDTYHVYTYRAYITYDEYEDFELYKRNTKTACDEFNAHTARMLAAEKEREDQRELAELKRLQEKYNVPSNT